MDATVFVMIVTLLMPDGTMSVHLTPYSSQSACISKAEIEASDPFVHRVSCSALEKGALTLNFRPASTINIPEKIQSQ